MDLWKSTVGMLEVELTSAEPERTLDAINAASIEVYAISFHSDLTRRFQIHRADFKAVQEIADRHGDSLKIRYHMGLFWTAKCFLDRPVLTCGIAFILALTVFLPSRVLFIRVDGNHRIPAKRILESAEACGIRFGASRREVRSERVKNSLLYAVPELQWAGVNTAGCVATISVQERSRENETVKDREVTSIIADRDGYITSATVTRGNALCAPGQSVKKGQTLISGYTDCGICIQATRAEGEVYAHTNRKITAVTPANCLKRCKAQKIMRTYSILLQKKRINLWKDSGIWDATCGRIEKTYSLSLPGGFHLPFSLCVEEVSSYEIIPSTLPEPQAEAALSFFSRQYLLSQMVAGTIRDVQQTISFTNGSYILNSDYVCEEMIGRERTENYSR